ncbi:hypothetical protein HYFRA_00012788 [Hymenoscyphus fraxineus]|uniref:Uncharacterized protein n=1 Tax=Hymenoscyphus fraxineus TaxID=746836 RepID=A0A9N9L955_9HELO|nr:hypothetical protein HYFRA_00012788 [Hymenoscyphus fraxineus]
MKSLTLLRILALATLTFATPRPDDYDENMPEEPCDQPGCVKSCGKAGVAVNFCRDGGGTNCMCKKPGEPGYGTGRG